jgi:two-component system, chemotaxis family, CheB/CheR fusion protein
MSSGLGEQRSIEQQPRADGIGSKGDLNDRQMREERLVRLRGDRVALMADMAAALAHEITQPLTAAANYLSAARRLVSGNPDAVAALDKAETQMIRAGRILGRLREFMASDEPGTVVQSLHEVIRGASELAAPALRRANVNLTLRLEAVEDLVLADRVEIEQALLHLIRSALKPVAGSTQRMVTIATSLANGAIQADIADTRSRASEPIDVELFEPLDSTNVSSLGDGLWIACSIIEAHRGRLWAASRQVGGAIFSFILPLVERPRDDG